MNAFDRLVFLNPVVWKDKYYIGQTIDMEWGFPSGDNYNQENTGVRLNSLRDRTENFEAGALQRKSWTFTKEDYNPAATAKFYLYTYIGGGGSTNGRGIFNYNSPTFSVECTYTYFFETFY